MRVESFSETKSFSSPPSPPPHQNVPSEFFNKLEQVRSSAECFFHCTRTPSLPPQKNKLNLSKNIIYHKLLFGCAETYSPKQVCSRFQFCVLQQMRRSGAPSHTLLPPVLSVKECAWWTCFLSQSCLAGRSRLHQVRWETF